MPQSVLGYEKLSNWALAKQTSEKFITEILNGQPEPPKYFAMMKKLNRQGPPLRQTESAKLCSPPTEQQLVLDVHPPRTLPPGHLINSIFLPPGSATVSWAGWLLDYQQTLALVAPNHQQAQATVRALQSIGLDRVTAIVLAQSLSAQPLAQSRRIQAQELNLNAQSIVDVRSQKEWDAGHLEQAEHQFLGYLQDHLAEVRADSVLYCQTGVRSLLASSLLERAGKSVTDIIGGYPAIQAAEREKATV